MASLELKIADQVCITCKPSVYDGIVGVIYEIQASSGYAMVLMPEGTELRLEGIKENAIRAQRSISEKRKPIPAGDPQWFPLKWLIPVDGKTTDEFLSESRD